MMRAMRMLAVAATILLTPAIWSQDIPLDVTGENVRKLTVIDSCPFTVTAPAGKGLYFWSIPAGVSAKDRNNELVVTACPRGLVTIGVKSITADWDKKEYVVKFAEITFSVGNLDPVPPPVPPDPPIPVVKGPLWIVVVEETADATANRGAFFFDKALAARVKEKNHRVRVIDQDGRDKNGATPADIKPYVDRAKGKTLPWMMVVPQDGPSKGKLIIEATVPPTPAAMLELIVKAGG